MGFKTPLRYPGGKQRLAPFVKEILDVNKINGHYVEPYAGGAGVAIELLLTRRIQHIHLNDSYIGIYAFWHSILNQNEEFCRKVMSASMTIEEWLYRREIVRRLDTSDLLELGFSIFYLNRCNRSGVLSAGVIGGLDQTGNYKMDARFSRNDLIRRIETIGLFRQQISLTNFDAEFYIANYIPNVPQDCLVYLDPPYYNKASDLYLNSYLKSDHARIAEIIQNQIHHNWILSYDGVPEIVDLYQERRNFLYDLQYTAGKVYKGKEIFIFSDAVEIPKHSSLNHVDQGIQNLI